MRPAIASGIVNGPGTHCSAIGPLQLAIHMVQTAMLESKSLTGTRPTKLKGIHNFKCNFLCLSCPIATFGLRHGGFVRRERLAAKGLLAMSFFSLLFLVTVPEVVPNVNSAQIPSLF